MSGGIDPGCIRIVLDACGGRISRVAVSSERPQVSAALVGRKADDAVRLVPLLFAICGKAQGRAAELALAAARGDPAMPGVDAAIALEAMREHLWRWLLDLPPLLGKPPMTKDFAAAVERTAREGSGSLTGLLADERITGLARCLETAMPGLPPAPMLPHLDAEASVRHWPRVDVSFSQLPHWRGAAAETGALARRTAKAGSALAMRWQARLDELDDWNQGRAVVGAAGTVSAVPVTTDVGRALVETARGLLMHEIALDGDRIASYVIVAPTEWNFHPRGAIPSWLAGCDATDRAALQARVALAVTTLDPCVRWELAWQ